MFKKEKNDNLTRKNTLRKIKKQVKGITLIALVVTIIVLLILAGIALNLTIGENGLFTRAKNAVETYGKSEEKQSLEFAVASCKMKNVNSSKIMKEDLENEIKNEFGNDKDFLVTDNEDGSFLVNMNDTKRMYYIDEVGKIIEQNKMLKISTANELKAFRDDVNSGNTYEDWYVYLTNDITLDSGEEWKPIGELVNNASNPYDNVNTNRFKGIFNGYGYEINGIYINTDDKVQGLFGLLDEGIIKNVGIGEQCKIIGGNATAGIVGYLYNGSKVYNCYNKSDIDGNFSGGIVGAANLNTTILNCYNNGNISGYQNTGGIIGNLDAKSNVFGCYNNGKIIVENYGAGGIAGNTDNSSTIEKSYNTETAQISGNRLIGDIVGQNNNGSTVKLCYNSGRIIGIEQNIGGIVGKNFVNAKLQDCYNIGIVNGKEQIGGIIGYNQDSEVSRCYNIGNITSSDTSYVGGIAGRVLGNSLVQMNYLEKGKVNSGDGYAIDGIETLTSNEMKMLNNILGENWKEDTNNINNGYPILNWQ